MHSSHLHSFILSFCLVLVLCFSNGCLTMVYAVGCYQERKDEIARTHADVRVRGTVTVASGQTMPRHVAGKVLAAGHRDSVVFQMESEGAGDSTQLIAAADEFSSSFEIELSDVRDMTMVFVCDGFQPATLDIKVPESSHAYCKPFVVDDARVVLYSADPPNRQR
jgi:hypothetical protein